MVITWEGNVDTGQKTESLAQLVGDIEKKAVALPEFQRDFVWDIDKTFDLFDSFVRDIFVGSLIYGIPSFEITVREIDRRPRSGKGSRAKLALTSYSKQDIDKLVKIQGFRLLLDGQQRATSIYRALTGIDPVYFVALSDQLLPNEVISVPETKRSLEEVISEFRGESLAGRVCISLHDVYKVLQGEAPRERDKVELFLKSNSFEGLDANNVENSSEFIRYLTQLKNLENLFRQEKLVAYYLLDTDEEKFALFFERSNSKGLQLNFIDILAAKLYVGFNLRNAIEQFEDQNPTIELNREVLVRAISFHVSGGRDMGRAYILSTLNHAHFSAHWSKFAEAYKRAYDYLHTTNLLVHPNWMPYENLLISLITFIVKQPHLDMSQISSDQARVIENWYWLSILSRRYSSAAQTFAMEDANAFKALAEGDFDPLVKILERVTVLVRTTDDLLVIHKKYDALYKGILNFINYFRGGFLNLENNNPVSMSSNLEDHHIFPNDYLRKNWAKVHDTLDSDVAIDCVVNRTLIPKLTNIKVSNKPPSKYLGEIRQKNPNIEIALSSHLMSRDLLGGEYDEAYDFFLDERATAILGAIKAHVLEPRAALLEQYKKPDAEHVR
jgi:hypothetical protein